MNITDTAVEARSGNIFAGLGLADADARIMKA